MQTKAEQIRNAVRILGTNASLIELGDYIQEKYNFRPSYGYIAIIRRQNTKKQLPRGRRKQGPSCIEQKTTEAVLHLLSMTSKENVIKMLNKVEAARTLLSIV